MQSMTFRELTDQIVALYNRSKFEDALQLLEQNMDSFPEESARTTFWRMCLLSRSGRSSDVLSVFRQGLDSGLWWAESQFIDTDLDSVRDLPEFQHLVTESHKKYEEARSLVERDQVLLLPESPASGKYSLLIALHGRNGSKESHLEHWRVASDKGWLVLSVQSTQPLFQGSYCWDDISQGMEDLLFYYKQVSTQYDIDPQRVIIAGFSQGSGMAIYTALSGRINVRGFIGIGTFFAEPDFLLPLASHAGSIKGYFVTGGKDHTLDKTKAIQNILKENNIQFGEEVHPDLGHEFPADFEPSFDKAVKFILE
jgi:predicted esterase